MKTNPFSRNSTYSLAPSTDVVSLVLKDTQGHEVMTRNLSEPFSMFLYHSGSSPVLLNHSAQLDAQSNQDLYEMNITETNSSLLVTLYMVNTDTEGQLRLRINNHNQTATFGNDVIVSTASSFPVSLTWSNLNAHGKCHVIVAFETTSSGLSSKAYRVQYTISFQEIGCYYWNESKDKWERNGCQVTEIRLKY